MKKRRKLVLAGAIFVVFAILLWGKPAELRAMKRTLGMNVAKGKLVTDTDTHGGFHGDGVTYQVRQFDEDMEIPAGEGWHPLPLSQNVKALLYGYTEGNCTIGPFIGGGEGDPFLPMIENGSYFFFDRHSESDDPYDDSDLFHRHSFNLTVALYDADTHRLHYVELDT